MSAGRNGYSIKTGETEMTDFTKISANELMLHKKELQNLYQELKAENLNLDITRGKPCEEQLDLANGMLDCVTANNFRSADGVDSRNYGGDPTGLPETRTLFSEYLETAPDQIIIGGNSSLAMMHDAIVRIILNGAVGGKKPWGRLPKIKFLCPSPGYDRHFFICEYLNIEMIPVEMDEHGPDMVRVENLVAADESIKGIWCVPKYSNPTGATYSDEVADRLAGMKTKADDFRIFWDNAYTAHHLTDSQDPLKSILTSCEKAGNPERVLMFGSTSKISIAGSGLAMMAGSRKNIEAAKKQLSFRTIGPDKINQLRHVNFFKNMDGISAHMKKHADIIKPKFDIVQQHLTSEIGDKNIAEWTRPNGGYFVSINTLDGCAAAVVDMAAAAGVKLTPAGATYPYKRDPRDRNIRIAPTFPPAAQVETAMKLVTICIQLVSVEKLLEGK
jgi:DNA-binding transcriptional MocR family regulator